MNNQDKLRLIIFTDTLEDNGDMFFSTGNGKSDYKLITETIKRQGYWAGIRLRYYFDDNLELVKTTERSFGNV